jgi:hypothetical protein
MRRGDHDSWHFDQTDFVVSMLLQPSERGGDFEYSPHIRTPRMRITTPCARSSTATAG